MTEQSLIAASGLHAGYGEQIVLRSVSVHCETGRTLAILGPGGAGKSTLLRVLGGPRHRKSNLWFRGALKTSASGCGWMGQRPADFHNTLAESLRAASDADPELLLEAQWRSAPPAAQALREVLDVPLCELPFELLRLIQLTLATVRRPDLVLLDEPEAELSSEARGWVQAMLADLRGRTTVVLATHNLKLARDTADSVLLLVAGKVVETGPAATFFDEPEHPRSRHFVRMGS